jgi:AcrR family transcriptional regulator
MTRKKGKIKQSPKLPAEERKAQLLQAARKLFVAKGYRGTSINEIAAEVGVTKGAVYFHFGSKEDILLELVRYIFDGYEERFREGLSEQLSPVEMFRRHLGMHLDCDAVKEADAVDIWIQAWRVPRIKRFITRRLNRARRDLLKLVDMSGLPSEVDREAVVVFLLAAGDGLASISTVTPRAVDRQAQIALVEYLFSSAEKDTKKKDKRRGVKSGSSIHRNEGREHKA